MTAPAALPGPVAALVDGRSLTEITIGRSDARVLRADTAGDAWFVKVGRPPGTSVDTSLADEAARLRWLAPHVAVPAVVHHGADDHHEWLITEALPGSDATRPEHQGDVGSLVRLLAEGLRHLHDTVPVDGCPFDARTGALVAQAEVRVAAGAVDASDFDPIHHGLGATDLLAHVIERCPDDPADLVVTHGDYCVPNVIVDRGHVSGYVDLGRAGVGDRYRDIGIAARSVAYNFGSHAVGPFVDAYGIEWPDLARVDFFVMLEELF